MTNHGRQYKVNMHKATITIETISSYPIPINNAGYANRE